MFSKSIEQMARKRFVDYAFQQHGHFVDWNLLSSERRIRWMHEASVPLLAAVEILETELGPRNQKEPVGGYERGVIVGQELERNHLRLRLQSMKEVILTELAKFEEKEARK